MNKQQLYLNKLDNDVEEKIYYLLMLHLNEVHKILPRIDDNKDYLNTLYDILNKAITNLRKETNPYNYKFFLRYTILIINTLLTYTPERNDLKKIKLEIINEFTKSDYDVDERIPLKYQMSEIRITYDVSYLTHLLDIFLKKRNYHNALYCFIGIKLIEPDYDDLENYEFLIFKNIEHKDVRYKEFATPKKASIILDANIVLNLVLKDVDNYKLSNRYVTNYQDILDKLQDNKFIILPSTIKEVETHLKFTKMNIEKVCKTDKRFNEKEIIDTLDKRFQELKNKYPSNLTTKTDTKKIEEFYSRYLEQLYMITIDKIGHSKLSHKLKKLTQREGLLPERADMELLAEAIELKKTNPNVCILSNDKDLYLFNYEIEKEFKIRVYK
ncbi:MAG: hypothetical protein PF487_10175 [Bacteroidales bacterium]|jgi:hypothetical protein|nr:hypothetical protein [Bacteroidales bacterium]